MRQRFFRVGQRQQVVEVLAVHARPAQMIRRSTPAARASPAPSPARDRTRSSGPVLPIESDTPCSATGKRLAHAHEVVQRATAGNEIVLGDGLEPVDGGLAVEDVGVVLGAETETKAQCGVVVSMACTRVPGNGIRGGAGPDAGSSPVRRPAVRSSVSCRPSWPARAQLRTRPWSARGSRRPCRRSGRCRRSWRSCRPTWPLQAFTPSHFTLPSSAAAALKETVANIHGGGSGQCESGFYGRSSDSPRLEGKTASCDMNWLRAALRR